MNNTEKLIWARSQLIGTANGVIKHLEDPAADLLTEARRIKQVGALVEAELTDEPAPSKSIPDEVEI